MARTIANGLLACEDCTIAIANYDFTSMDDATETRIKTALDRLSDRFGKDAYPVIGDELGFSWRGCDCCQDGLGGDKHELIILGA
jgi:hypothetical protein